MPFELVQLLVPIFICVVLPVAIVWILNRKSMNRTNKNAEVLLKAIESNPNIDLDKLVTSLGTSMSPRELLHKRLLNGCIYSLLGLAIMTMTLIECHVISNFNTAIDSDLEFILLTVAGSCLAIGIGYLITWFVTRKSVKQDESAK